jgi:DNA-binding LytR/AlgR family response regulator
MAWRIWILFSIVFGVALFQAETIHEYKAAHTQASTEENPLISVCPAASGEFTPPDFSSSECYSTSMQRLEPIGGMIWVRVVLPASETLSTSTDTIGMSVVGNSARMYFLNGRSIGATGEPGLTKAEEKPGLLEDILYVSRDYLKDGEQELVMLMSCHYRRDLSANCLDAVHVADYGDIQAHGLSESIPALLAYSVLTLATVFFASMAVRGFDRVGSTLLSLICGAATLHIVMKCLHFLTSYPYTLQDARTALTTLSSFLIGVFFASFVLRKFVEQKAFAIVAIVSVFTIILMATTSEPQLAARFGLAVPLLTTVIFTTGWAIGRRENAIQYSVMTVLIALFMVIQNGNFVVHVAFYTLIGIVTFHFVNHTGILDRRPDHEEKTKKLEKAVERVQAELAAAQRTPDAVSDDEQILVRLSDRTQYVRVGSISHCNGARDYVEICFVDGKEILHNGSLQEMEKSLPDLFIRVHRSHIVNALQIQSLTRQTNGGGVLKMRNGSEVPVSRRIMPKMKSLLDKGSISVLAPRVEAVNLNGGA